MKHDFIYLDWNVVKALKEMSTNSIFAIAINALKTQYIIPFSFAHLCDRQKNMSKDNMKYIKSDLEFFDKLSSGYMFDRCEDDYGIAKQNILEKYDEVTFYKQTQYPSFDIPQEILEKIKELGVPAFFKDKDNVKWFPAIALTAFSRFDCNDELYNKIREIFELDPPESMAFFRDLQNPEIKPEDLKMIVDNLLKDDQSSNSSICHKIGMAYLLLDFNPSYRERVNHKSNFTNICTDNEHMLNASFAKYYITQDKMTLKKTRFVYKTYGVNTEVYNIEEFIKSFELNKDN